LFIANVGYKFRNSIIINFKMNMEEEARKF